MSLTPRPPNSRTASSVFNTSSRATPTLSAAGAGGGDDQKTPPRALFEMFGGGSSTGSPSQSSAAFSPDSRGVSPFPNMQLPTPTTSDKQHQQQQQQAGKIVASTNGRRQSQITIQDGAISRNSNNNNNNNNTNSSNNEKPQSPNSRRSSLRFTNSTTTGASKSLNAQNNNNNLSSSAPSSSLLYREESTLVAPGRSTTDRDAIPKPPNWGWKRRASQTSKGGGTTTTNDQQNAPFAKSVTGFPFLAGSGSGQQQQQSSSSSSQNNNNKQNDKAEASTSSASKQSQYASLTQHPLLSGSITNFPWATGSFSANANSSASQKYSSTNQQQQHGSSSSTLGKYPHTAQHNVSFLLKDDVVDDGTMSSSNQLHHQKHSSVTATTGTENYTPLREPVPGERASLYSQYLQTFKPQKLHTHADLKRQGHCIHQDDHSNLVGSASGQIASLLVNVVTSAGVITEGEILESLQGGTSYKIRCPLPEENLRTMSEKASRRFRKGAPRFTQNVQEESLDPDLKEKFEQFTRAVTPDGLTDEEVQHQTEVERATMKKFFTATFKRRDVLPFGFEAPSAVFNRLGRHTNLGLVVGWDSTYFTYQIEQRIFDPNFSPTRHAENQRRGFATRNAVEDDARNYYKIQIISAALSELQLPPSLTRGHPRNSYRVGTVVECRRFGMHDLDEGVVIAVNRDVTYKIRFKSDEVIQDGILHSDVRLVNESRAERCGVRDRVLVGLMGAKRATVIQCYEDGRFKAVTDDGEQLLLGDSNVLSVRPICLEAVGAARKLIELFDLLDETFNGKVSWLKFRREILGGPWIPGVLAPLGTSTHVVPTTTNTHQYLHIPQGRVSPSSLRRPSHLTGFTSPQSASGIPRSPGNNTDHYALQAPRSVAESRLRLHRLSVIASIHHNQQQQQRQQLLNQQQHQMLLQQQMQLNGMNPFSGSSLPGSAEVFSLPSDGHTQSESTKHHQSHHSVGDGGSSDGGQSSRSKSPASQQQQNLTPYFGSSTVMTPTSSSAQEKLFAPAPPLSSLRRESLLRWANIDLPPHLLEVAQKGMSTPQGGGGSSTVGTNSPSSTQSKQLFVTYGPHHQAVAPPKRPLKNASPMSLEIEPKATMSPSANATLTVTRRPRKESVVRFKFVDEHQQNPTTQNDEEGAENNSSNQHTSSSVVVPSVSLTTGESTKVFKSASASMVTFEPHHDEEENQEQHNNTTERDDDGDEIDGSSASTSKVDHSNENNDDNNNKNSDVLGVLNTPPAESISPATEEVPEVSLSGVESAHHHSDTDNNNEGNKTGSNRNQQQHHCLDNDSRMMNSFTLHHANASSSASSSQQQNSSQLQTQQSQGLSPSFTSSPNSTSTAAHSKPKGTITVEYHQTSANNGNNDFTNNLSMNSNSNYNNNNNNNNNIASEDTPTNQHFYFQQMKTGSSTTNGMRSSSFAISPPVNLQENSSSSMNNASYKTDQQQQYNYYNSNNNNNNANSLNLSPNKSSVGVEPSRRASLFGGGLGSNESFAGLTNVSMTASNMNMFIVGGGAGGGGQRSRGASMVSLPRLYSPRASLVPVHLLNSSQQQGYGGSDDYFGISSQNQNNAFHSFANLGGLGALNSDSNMQSGALPVEGANQVRSRRGTDLFRRRSSTGMGLFSVLGTTSALGMTSGLEGSHDFGGNNSSTNSPPNLVSLISNDKKRDFQSSAIVKEMQRQECMHDEVQEALEKAYEVFNAIKGIPPNGFHAGHDCELSFLDMAFLFEKVARDLGLADVL